MRRETASDDFPSMDGRIWDWSEFDGWGCCYWNSDTVDRHNVATHWVFFSWGHKGTDRIEVYCNLDDEGKATYEALPKNWDWVS